MSKIIYNDEQLKQKQFEDVSNDVIEEIDARQENAKVYYPYFEIYRKLKSRQESSKYDLVSIFIAILSFLLYTGKLDNRRIRYEDICDFVKYFIKKEYGKNISDSENQELVNQLLDDAQNKGTNFTFLYYDLKTKKRKQRHIKYIEIKLDEDGELNYYITTQGIDFYLKTKEFPDSTQVTINLLLFRKQIEKGSFRFAYDTVRRLNIEVQRKIEQKESILEGLMYGGKEGIDAYNQYNQNVINQFAEEEELFTDVTEIIKNLYNDILNNDKVESLSTKEKESLDLIMKIQKELNKAVSEHTRLLREAISMTSKYDEISNMKIKGSFSQKFQFEKEFEKITEELTPDKLQYIVSPFLLPKISKEFNPIKAFEEQRLTKQKEEVINSEKMVFKEMETIDMLTQKRVENNMKFYFTVLVSLLKEKREVTLKDFADYIKQNFKEEYLYNSDFIPFVIYMNSKKKIVEDELFNQIPHKKVVVIPQKEDIELGNGLKVTDLLFIYEDK